MGRGKNLFAVEENVKRILDLIDFLILQFEGDGDRGKIADSEFHD